MKRVRSGGGTMRKKKREGGYGRSDSSRSLSDKLEALESVQRTLVAEKMYLTLTLNNHEAGESSRGISSFFPGLQTVSPMVEESQYDLRC